MEKHYVEFAYPGLIVAETSSREMAVGESITLPRGAVGFRTYTITEALVDGELLRGARKNVSGWRYPGGSAIAAINVPTRFPGEANRVLRSNVENNKLRGVIKTCRGTVVEWGPDDAVLP